MPTERQKRAVKNIGKYRTEAEGLVKAGFSPSYAKSGLIKRTKPFKDLMEKNLPDNLLLKVHKEGLSAGKKIFKNNNESGEVEFMGEEPDYPTRHKYLDTAYKIKGRYPKEGIGVAIQVNFKDNDL